MQQSDGGILVSALRSYGLVPTRADRGTYVFYDEKITKSKEAYIASVKRRQGDVPWDAVHRTLKL